MNVSIDDWFFSPYHCLKVRFFLELSTLFVFFLQFTSIKPNLLSVLYVVFGIVGALLLGSTQEKLIIAGVDNPSISETLNESEKNAELGADLIRIRIPRRRDTINKYFDEVLKNICKPVLIIHQMSPGGFDSSMTTEGANPDQIGRFCDNDNVFGYIASHLVRFEMMTRKFVPKSKQFWVPNAMLMPTMSLEGANGGCFMLGNIAPKICRNIINLGLNGNYNEAKKINDTLIDLDWNILSRGAAGIKYALDLLGFVGGDPRKPLNILSETDKKNIKDSLNVSGITEVE